MTNPHDAGASLTDVSVAPPDTHRLRGPLDFLPIDDRAQKFANWIGVVVGIYVLITAVGLIGSGFKAATGDQAAQLFQFAANPFVGLMIGVLATAATQSSSTTTSITVGLVAGGLPLAIAIPVLMGANIGTTLTNTLVSLGMVRDKEGFKRAFAAATVHDFFNLIAVAIFLPLELAFGLLARASGWLSEQTSGTDGGLFAAVFGSIGVFVKAVTTPGSAAVIWAASPLPDPWRGIALIAIGIALILFVISLIGKLLKVLMVGKAADVLHSAIGRGPLTGIGSGAVVTVMVQSSSTTTSLAVPLAGSGQFSLRQIYPFTVGANIGTTITALIAAFGFTGIEASLALQAAYVHLLFNLFATAVIFGIPFLRVLPLRGATWLAQIGTENKLYAAAWVLGVFVLIPLALIFLTVIF
ncbi:Na/Pi symporter [Hoyosella rhizosphaerae]|uniref:Sodium:phosphate symporter n=1 Tax=Hoyosella rhizosphaerae TaxID=1755582 RepID=A0A916U5L1_9ACTN|nr:Na/Pi symporter [Hoyosella rhizosphaerae]MBN4927794.1 Na/Pi symporter [Hoyosella rhizosphaerae]GGC61478.1 sodium:phosphate symporter [Hoyosella rhizosphaerae]